MRRKNKIRQNTEHRTQNTDSVVSGQWSVGTKAQRHKGTEKLANGEWRMVNKKSKNRKSTISNSPLSAISHQPSAVPYSLSPISYLMPILLLAASILLVYSNTFDASFHLDDDFNIINNRQIRNLANLGEVIKGTDRPVAMIINALNFHFNALNVRGYHYVNIGIHILTSLVLYFIFLNTLGLPVFSGKYAEKKQFLRRGDVPTLPDNRNVDTSLCRNNYVTTHSVVTRTVLVPTLRVGTNIKHNYDNRKYFLSFAGALIFALHPIQTQAITYIIQGRMAGLATLFYLSALLFFIIGYKTGDRGQGLGDRKPQNPKSNSQNLNPKPQPLNPYRLQENSNKQQSSAVSRSLSPIPYLLSPIYYLLAILSSALGMGTKEITVTAPIMILMYDYFFISAGNIREFKKRAFVHIGLFLTLGVSFYFIITCTKFADGVGAGVKILTPLQYLFTQFSVIIYYIFLLLFPFKQNVDYDWLISKSFFEPATIGSFILIILILVMAIRIGFPFPSRRLGTRRNRGTGEDKCSGMVKLEQGVATPCSMGSMGLGVRQDYRLLTFCILWYFITLAPESSIIPIKDVIFEHRLYLPSAFFLLFFVLLFDKGLETLENRYKVNRSKDPHYVFNKIKAKYFGYFVLLLTGMFLGALTYWRNDVWRDDITFWSDCVKKSPNKSRPNTNLASAYGKKGEVEKALPLLIKAVKLDPTNGNAFNNLGICYRKIKKPREAIKAFEKAIKLNQGILPAYNNIANAYIDVGEYDTAIKFYKKALNFDHYYIDAHKNLGQTYEYLGNYDLALREYNRTIEIEPRYGEGFVKLGLFYANKLHDKQKGLEYLTKALNYLSLEEIEKTKGLIAEIEQR